MVKGRKINVSIMLYGITVPVGKLWQHHYKGHESASFEYDDEWLDNPNHFALEPALFLTKGLHYTDKVLFGAIEDSTPGCWGRLLIQHFNQDKSLSELDYLLGIDDEARQGALRFSENIDGPYLKESSVSKNSPNAKLEDLLLISEKVLTNNESKDELEKILNYGSSLNGSRPKVAIIEKNGIHVIAKFPKPDDVFNVPAWEAVAFTLAKTAGITVPNFRLENIHGKSVFVIKRFDREGESRVPFMSAMSIFGAKDNGNYSFVDFTYMLNKYGAQPENDCEELWRRMVFGLIISNTNNHLRNHGFLYNGKGWVLSPAYDLNPDYLGSDFSVRVNHEKNNTIENAIKVADKFKLPETRAHKILEEIKSAVADWRKAAKSFDIPDDEIEKMKTAFKV
jgi:serine/threonine-protein kinase HipA